MADFKPIKGSKIGELAANFDIVLGRTPDERTLQPQADRRTAEPTIPTNRPTILEPIEEDRCER